MLKKVIIFIAAMSINNVYSDTRGEYSKSNAVASIKSSGKVVAFIINSSVDMHACEISGAAVMIDAHRAAYTSNDPKDKCTVLLTLGGDKLKVTTNSCESYCGLSAQGSMDGLYKVAEASRPTPQGLEGAVAEGFAKAAENANARGAIMVDQNTRLDQTVAGPGAQLTYLYSFPNHSSRDITRSWLLTNSQPIVKKGVCGSEEMKSSLQNGGIYIFSYSGNDGIEIARFEIGKHECGYL